MKREKSGRVLITQRISTKVAAVILFIIMLAAATASVVGAVIMAEYDIYTMSWESWIEQRFSENARLDSQMFLSCLLDGRADDMASYCESGESNIIGVSIRGEDGLRYDYGVMEAGAVESENHVIPVGEAFSYSDYNPPRNIEKYNYTNALYYREENGENIIYFWNMSDEAELKRANVTITIDRSLPNHDDYYRAVHGGSIAYALRFWVLAVCAAAVIAAIALFVFLLCASGHRVGFDKVQPGWGTGVPFDVLTFLTGLAGFILLQIMVESTYISSAAGIATVAIGAVALVVIAVGWCMSFALRVKLGSWWKNTVVYYLLRLIWRIGKKLVRGLHAVFNAVPLVWKTVVICVGISFIEFIVILLTWYEPDNLLIWWVIEKLIVFLAVIFIALTLRRLQQGARALAEGNLNHQVDTQHMYFDFKQHGENLNRIAEGMTLAVEQRIKSERMKTELITNVSHDIKTPLTSVINYADLISKEPPGSEKTGEYAEVLHRQADRLKRLVDDLVEASKAASGNLEVVLEPCQAGVLLTQAAGEYEQRLKECRLELITTQPEHPVNIMADGRRLWRVIDNLMNNICKYAMSGTRVYLTLEEKAGHAVFSFKNTSRDALNLSPDELTERFVQGDAARRSEGNGLGLSIAKSLTELQNGTMEIIVDGDLFKVVLKFPIKK